MSVENRSISDLLKERKLEDIDMYKFKLYAIRYKKCKYGMYISIAFLILSFSIFPVIEPISLFLFAISLFSLPSFIILMGYYMWKKRQLGLTYTEAVWHELAVDEENFTHDNYEDTIGHLQNMKIFIKNSEKEVLPEGRASEIIEYINTVSEPGKQEDLLQTTFREVSEILIADLHRLEDHTISEFINNTAGTDNRTDIGILQGRVWDTDGMQTKLRGILPLFITVILVVVSSLLFGIQVGVLLTSIAMIVINYLDVYNS